MCKPAGLSGAKRISEGRREESASARQEGLPGMEYVDSNLEVAISIIFLLIGGPIES